MQLRSVQILLFFILLTSIKGNLSGAQNNYSYINNHLFDFQQDSINKTDTSHFINNNRHGIDSVPFTVLESDSTIDLLLDSNMVGKNELKDSIPVRKKRKSKDAIDDPVNYTARDSIVVVLNEQKVYLYGEAVVKYQDIELEAAYVEFDMINDELYATGIIDTTGEVVGLPIFRDGDEEFESKTIRYNFKTKRGFITEIYTKQAEGYLHSQRTKRQDDGAIHIKNGKYTTCDAKHPHFYVGLTKAIVIPDKEIVSGPAYMVVEDIPLPLILPFGFFPNTENRSAGILIPTYGEESQRGFYLREGGWYWPVNDYTDLTITGDVYSTGTWGVGSRSTYKKRYKFNGSFNGKYFNNVTGERGINESIKKDFSIQWSHNQDPKANPYQTFRASVNYSSTSYDKNHSYDLNQRLNNTKQSSISYSKSWPNKPYSLQMSLNHSQNSIDNSVNMTLPSMSFSSGRFYPFRFKESEGKPKWYENLQLKYDAQMENSISTYDSLLFTETKFEDFKTGFKHTVPFSTNIKILKFLNFTPSVSYTGMAYLDKVEYVWDGDSIDAKGNSYGQIDTITTRGLYYAHGWNPTASFSVNPKIYGMYQFKNSRVMAIRHMVMPSVSLGLTPNMGGLVPDYYRKIPNVNNPNEFYTRNGKPVEYSIYEGGRYGVPTSNRESGSVNISLKNNVEMKYMPKDDSITKPEKITLLDNLNFSTRYNIFADSLNWSDIGISASTSLFNKKLSLTYSGTVDPYIHDSTVKINKLFITEKGQIGRLTRSTLSLSTRFSSSAGKNKKEGEEASDIQDDPTLQQQYDEFGNPVDDFYTGYVDFTVPWSISFSYGVSINYDWLKEKQEISSHTLRFSGDLSLTPKWKINFSSGYDLREKEFTSTQFSINRDLHCWQMSIRVVPFGNYKSYEFKISAKSALLKDLKWDKKQNWRDN